MATRGAARQTLTALTDPRRLSAIDDTGLRDAPPVPAFDRLTKLAATGLGAPMAAITLVGDGEQVLAGAYGIPEPWGSLRRMSVSHSLCVEVVRSGAPFVVADARADLRVRNSPAVAEHGVGAYLGVPLRVGGGPVLGAVCVCDSTAHAWSGEDRQVLEDIAEVAATILQASSRPGTASHEAEQRRRVARAEGRWRVAFANAPVAMAELALDGRINFANPALAALADRPAESLVGVSILELYHPDDVERAGDSLHRLQGDGATVERVERRLVRGDGSVLWVAGRAATVRPDPGDEPVILVHLMDITPEREHRLAVEELSARFTALVEHGSDPILLLDGDLVVRYASPAYRRVVGLPPGSACGRPIDHRLHADDVAGLRSLLYELCAHPDDVVTCEVRIAHASEGWRHLEVTAANHLADPAIAGLVCTYRDVTGRVEAAEQLAYQATHDPLTGLANRSLLLDHLGLAVGRSDRSGDACALYFIDLDGFKRINDTFGHSVGDELLLAVADQLSGATRPHDTVARLGGDEFVVLVEDVGSVSEAMGLAERFRRAVGGHPALGGRAGEVTVTCSVGVALYDRSLPEPLLERADVALYLAKTGVGTAASSHSVPAVRIGMVSPYSLTLPGGVQAQVLGLGRALRRLGHETRVLGPCDGPPPDPNVTPLGNSIPTAANGSVAAIAPDPSATLRVIRALRDETFDVVHVHEPLVPGTSLSTVLFGEAPMLATFHRSGGSGGYRVTGGGSRIAMSRVAMRTAVSQEAADTAWDVVGGDYTLVWNGIEVDRFAEAPPWVGPRPPGTATVVFIGRHESRKGLAVLLDAFGRLGRQPGDAAWRLWVIGEGPDTERLTRATAGDPRIEWLGRLTDTDKMARLRAADVFCAPSTGGESFGIVLLEALAAGTPVVASDLPGYRNVVRPGRDAVLVPPGDPAALAEALRTVGAAGPAVDAMVSSGRRRAEQFSMRRLAERYLELYDVVRATTRRPESAVRLLRRTLFQPPRRGGTPG